MNMRSDVAGMLFYWGVIGKYEIENENDFMAKS